jgi:hypothetical protein
VAIDNTVVQAGGSGIVIDGSAAGTTTITGFANNAVSGNHGRNGISVTSATFDSAVGTAAYDQVGGGTTVVGVLGNGVGGSGISLSSVGGRPRLPPTSTSLPTVAPACGSSAPARSTSVLEPGPG